MSLEERAEREISGMMAAAMQRPKILKRLGQLVTLGNTMTVAPTEVLDVMRAWQARPDDPNFERQQKRLLAKAWDLPEAAVNSSLTAGELVEFGGNLQGVDSEGMGALRDPETWKLLKLRGRGGKKEAEIIAKDIWAENLGVPKDTAFRLSLEDLGNGVAGLQARGMEGMIDRPEFWDDYTGSGDKAGALNKWKKIAQEEEKVASAAWEQEIKKKIMALNKAMAERDREWARLRELRDEDRKRRKAKEKRRRRRRWKRGTVELDDLGFSTLQQVSTPWGDNYVLQQFGDGTTMLYRIDEEGRGEIVVPRGSYAYSAWTQPSGTLHVTPVLGHNTGRRRASPMDLPEGRGGGPEVLNP